MQQLAHELWGECDGVSILENRFGNGRVIWGRTLGEVLGEMRIQPDLACLEATVGEEIRYIHRNIEGDDVYFVASGVPDARRFLCTFRTRGKIPELWWPDTRRTEPVVVFKKQQEEGAFISHSEQERGTVIPLNLAPYESVFVVFRAGAGQPTDHVTSILRDGVEVSGLAPKLIAESLLQHEYSTTRVKPGDESGYVIETAHFGTYEVKTAGERILRGLVPKLPEPWLVKGPWNLRFPKGLGAPERVALEQLISWTEHPDPGVKYFSGTATYSVKLEVPSQMLGKNRVLYLDLGRVSVIAEIRLNNRDLGILWKPPFRVEVTDILRSGANDLVVSVVNLWPNRLIGDEQLPSDCKWMPYSTISDQYAAGWGEALSSWPQWLLEDKPSPTGRVAFTTWKHWSKDDSLLESCLLGPVRIIAAARTPLE